MASISIIHSYCEYRPFDIAYFVLNIFSWKKEKPDVLCEINLSVSRLLQNFVQISHFLVHDITLVSNSNVQYCFGQFFWSVLMKYALLMKYLSSTLYAFSIVSSEGCFILVRIQAFPAK